MLYNEIVKTTTDQTQSHQTLANLFSQLYLDMVKFAPGHYLWNIDGVLSTEIRN